MGVRLVKPSRLHEQWLLLISCCLALAACGSSIDEDDFEYVGKFSIVIAPSLTDVFASESFYFLEVDNIDYRLTFDDETNFNNVESSELGDLWFTGAKYGVNGELNGTVILVDSIAYLGEFEPVK